MRERANLIRTVGLLTNLDDIGGGTIALVRYETSLINTVEQALLRELLA